MNDENRGQDFIRTIIDGHNRTGRFNGTVHTRFPPEPNGCLHIGHAKSFCLNFGIAAEYGGKCNLRFDDTNPVKEDEGYVDSIREDVRWLGFDWEDREYYASDYFDRLFEDAVKLINAGKAYVDDQSAEEIRKHRGTLKEAGQNSPFRDRTPGENLELFMKMKAGEFADGTRVLRAKIDMTSPNLNLRDPVMYRISHTVHHRTKDKWCIYPMYDFAHGLCDSYEGITHSICTLEFEDHRPLYDWFLDALEVHHPQQIEFARLNISNTVLSKRKLLALVKEGHVDGWDDPRMPTLSGLRRRGYSPASIRNFATEIGVSKTDSIINIAMFEHCARVDLNRESPRFMAVLDPLKLVITNYDENSGETTRAVNNPEKPEDGHREVPFSRVLYIERGDFMENPPKKFYRMAPGREVRLRYAYFVKCTDVIKDEKTGEIMEVHCTYDPATRGGDAPDGRKVKATLHWVSARHAINAAVRHYDHLFDVENPNNVPEGKSFTDYLNPESLTTLDDCKLEPAVAKVKPGTRVQFERLGYYVADIRDHSPENPVFNRTVGLRDDWARIQKQKRS